MYDVGLKWEVRRWRSRKQSDQLYFPRQHSMYSKAVKSLTVLCRIHAYVWKSIVQPCTAETLFADIYVQQWWWWWGGGGGLWPQSQCMLVDRYANQHHNNSWIFPEPTTLQMKLHARCKLLVSDNILLTHVRPRPASDVPSKYSLVKRLRLSPISGSSSAACEHLWKHSTTGCILVKTRQGNWMLAKHRIWLLWPWY